MEATNAQPKLLVIDDEPVVCQSCERIFEGQGYQVETTTDSREGLKLASGNDYSAILLDVKMPGMDGLEFLHQFRKTNRTAPVIMITGYSSIQDAAAAMRLGAVDYIPKPFTPAEISDAVKRLTAQASAVSTTAPASKAVSVTTPGVAPHTGTWSPLSDEYRFLNDGWVQLGQDGSVRLGAFISREESNAVESVTLPKIGEMVYRGLPLAAIKISGTPGRSIPAVVSGEVVEVNTALATTPGKTFTNPCHEGWLVRVRPENLSEDMKYAQTRKVVLANANAVKAKEQRNQLAYLGVQVHPATTIDGVLGALRESQAQTLIIDAAAFGERGPEMVDQINSAAPAVKIIVVGATGGNLEGAYRSKKIFFYAVEPFADNEILDILHDAFQPQAAVATHAAPVAGLPRWVRKIRITNRLGHNVALLVSGGKMLEYQGLGQRLVRSILEAAYPIRVTLGYDTITPIEIRREAAANDRVVLILTDNIGRIPGSMVRNAASDVVKAVGDAGKKVVAMAVQPNSGEVPLAFEDLTTQALAEHILGEMAAA
jgi:DNA-binding response OmpR family regulator/glycine cleavage system H lipoate-binding protein